MNTGKGHSKLWFLVLLLVVFAAGCGSKNSATQSSDKAISVYSLDGVTGTIDETAKTISVTMPYGTNVTAMIATLTTAGTGAAVGAVAQISGSTANDFTSPVYYIVTAADSSTATYTVTVTEASSFAKAITAYSLAGATGTIDETAKTISVTMPYGTNVTALIATFSTSGTGVKAGMTRQVSGTTANDFASPVAYIVTAADGSTATYTATVTVALNTAKAITAYSLAGATGTIDETAKTISVAMPYGTNRTALIATFSTSGTGVKAGTTAQISGTTANNFTSPAAYIVTAADGSTATYTVTVTVTPDHAKAITAYSLNGSAGIINEAAKTISVTMPYGTNVTALIATFTRTGTGVITAGTTAQTSGTTANNFTTPNIYKVTAADGTSASYAVTVTVALNSAKALTAYSLAGVSGEIYTTSKTISVTMPNGTNVTSLIATFTRTGTGVITVAATTQTSGTTPNNFTGPKTYKVTAADGTTAYYTVTVTVAPTDAKAITAYSLAGVAGSVNEEAKTIAVTVPFGTNRNGLVATFLTTGKIVTMGTTTQTSGTTTNDFTNPVDYTVIAADSTTAKYTVTATVAGAGSAGPFPVDLGTAGNFVILAKAGVSTTGTTAVTGDIGLSPAAATYITGFSLIADASNVYAISGLVTGQVFAADYAVPTPDNLTTAVSDMETAFTDAAGRAPDYTELYAGDISGQTLVPGTYKWGTGVLITSAGVTLSGGANDVWIFQIAQNLTVSNSAIVTLNGGAQAKNIFWQVAGQTTLGTAADFKGIILSQTLISLNTGAMMHGRALAQTAVTLNANAVTQP